MTIYEEAYAAATNEYFYKGDMFYTYSGIFKVARDAPPGEEKVEVIQSIGKGVSVRKRIPKVLLFY